MPSFDEELARMQWLKRENKVSGDERVKLIFPRLEAKRKVRNVEGRTRLVKQLDTPETYASFVGEFARYIENCGNNPQIAYELMLTLLKAIDDESISRYARGAHESGSAAD